MQHIPGENVIQKSSFDSVVKLPTNYVTSKRTAKELLTEQVWILEVKILHRFNNAFHLQLYCLVNGFTHYWFQWHSKFICYASEQVGDLRRVNTKTARKNSSPFLHKQEKLSR